ncbi:MAG TPA: SHOCT domain-containing protein [Xanthobacteraceae bacterium]|nr:SHOCT domain-containing protein [Xanthobacteraceae bacterium]
MWNKTHALLLACTLVALSAAQAAAQTQQPQGPYGPGPWWGDYGWSFWWMCPLMMLVMVGIMGVIMLMRHQRGDGRWSSPWHGPAHASLQILDERFARGEIHKDEYAERRAAILSGR